MAHWKEPNRAAEERDGRHFSRVARSDWVMHGTETFAAWDRDAGWLVRHPRIVRG